MLIFIYTNFIFFLISWVFNNHTIMNNKYLQRYFAVMFVVISTYVVGVTEINYVDREVYTSNFENAVGLPLFQYVSSFSGDYLFRIIVWSIARITSDAHFYYIILHLIFIGILYIGIKPIHGNKVFVVSLFIYLNYPFYYSYTLNVLRQGIALVIIILAIRYMLEKKGVKFILSVGIAALFHLSSVFFSMVLILLYFIKHFRIKYSLIIYGLTALLYITHLSDNIVSFIPVSLEYLEAYSSQRLIDSYGGGYKLKFLLFNTFFLLIFVFALYSNRNLKYDIIYNQILNVYILFSAIFSVMGFIAYADRVAGYSWFIVPLLAALMIEKMEMNIAKFSFLLAILFIGMFTTQLIQ